MFCVLVAGFTIRFHNQYERFRELCEGYLIENIQEPDFDVPALDEEIISQRWFYQHDPNQEIRDRGQVEYNITPLRYFYPQLPSRGAFWIHAAAIEMEGIGYALTATSGYGKSTQGRLWLSRYPEQAKIINGDEPIVRKMDGEYRIYGTPFCGKEGYHVNTDVPLHGLCWLQHGEENKIEPLGPLYAYAAFVRDYQHMGSMTPENREAYMTLLEDFFEHVPAYILTCNQEPGAAETAYEGMKVGWEHFCQERQSQCKEIKSVLP